MSRRKWALAVVVSIGLGSCVGARSGEERPQAIPQEATLKKIARTGVFAVGTQPDAPPFAVLDRKGEYQGFSIDLARMVHRQVERELGRLVDLKFIPVTPATRIPRLLDGTVDMIAEVMTYTRERDRLVDFSITVFVTGQSNCLSVPIAAFRAQPIWQESGLARTVGRRARARFKRWSPARISSCSTAPPTALRPCKLTGSMPIPTMESSWRASGPSPGILRTGRSWATS